MLVLPLVSRCGGKKNLLRRNLLKSFFGECQFKNFLRFLKKNHLILTRDERHAAPFGAVVDAHTWVHAAGSSLSTKCGQFRPLSHKMWSVQTHNLPHKMWSLQTPSQHRSVRTPSQHRSVQTPSVQTQHRSVQTPSQHRSVRTPSQHRSVQTPSVHKMWVSSRPFSLQYDACQIE